LRNKRKNIHSNPSQQFMSYLTNKILFNLF